MSKSHFSWSRRPSRLPAPLDLRAEAPPVRLGPAEVTSPFAPGREIAFARASGAALEPLGLRDGDHVALLRRDTADHGDLAAVLGPDGRAALWKVRPEADGWRLSTGGGSGSRWLGAAPRVQGVVVGVLRRFR
jgi:hypothetical protein